jgi:large subunit ribosomal protein L44e
VTSDVTCSPRRFEPYGFYVPLSNLAARSIYMEMPRRMNTYCPHCNEHYEHEVEKVRSGRETGMKWIDRQRERNSGIGNDGKFSKVPGGDKPTKKTQLKYRCGECGKAHQREGWRAGRLTFQE